MGALAAAEILALWEQGLGMHAVDRAVLMLAAAAPGCGRDELAALPLGQRDARLMALREASFGDRLNASARCPGCGALAEFELGCAALRLTQAPAPAPALRLGDYTLEVRPVNSFDLAAVAATADVDTARRTLMQRCVTSARRGGVPVAPATLPEALSEDIGAAVLAADPGAETLLDLVCPQCARAWQVTLDVVDLLWSEIAARARRLLIDVHLLARAYGWSEAAILGLSEARRAAYLQQVSG